MENKRALIVSRAWEQREEWRQALIAVGWTVEMLDGRDQVIARIPEFFPALLLLDLGEGASPDAVEESFAQRCRDSGLAVIAVLRAPTPGDVVVAFRRGAIDVLIPAFTTTDLLAAVERAGHFKDLYQENMDYRRQLERANQKLQENLNILKMDQLAGRQVQRDVLPREPLYCRDYCVSHSIVPSLYLSGDFVGYNSALDRYILFYFGDVSGHGASSAFVTVMLAFLLRQLRRRHIAELDFAALARAPEGLAEHLNRQMLAMDIDKHLTFFAGAIDVERHTLRYVVSGLFPPPVLVEDGVARFLPGEGKPLGLFKNATWEIQECALSPGAALVIVSDGLLEQVAKAPESAGREQVLLRALAGVAPDHAAICRALEMTRVQEAPDDASVLTVVRNAQP